MNSGKIVLGVLAGVAAGAAVGILFAPDKGSSTRKKISKKGREYAEDLGEKFDDFIQGIAAKFEALKEEAERTSGNGKTKPEETKAEVGPALKS